MNIAIYPGSFDPITLGHLDIIRRAARCFDKVCVCVMVNCQKKQPMFTPERRLADFARKKGAHILVKGVRNCADWELENQMARINAGICPGLETVLLPASAEYEHFSSTMVRETMIHLSELKATLFASSIMP